MERRVSSLVIVLLMLGFGLGCEGVSLTPDFLAGFGSESGVAFSADFDFGAMGLKEPWGGKRIAITQPAVYLFPKK